MTTRRVLSAGWRKLRSGSPILRACDIARPPLVAEAIGIALREQLAARTAPRPLARQILRRPAIGFENLQYKLGGMVHARPAARPIANGVRMHIAQLRKLALRYCQ
jgi:hypothetical protein